VDPQGNPSGTVDPDELAHRLGEVARSLEHLDDLQETLQAIVDAAVRTIPGAGHASISAVEKRREVHTLAATDNLSSSVDRAQYETHEGPCLSTLWEHETARLTDVSAETRWPAFVKQAEELGMASMLAVRLYVEGDELGVLNLLSEQVNAFDETSEHVALLFASHAAVAMAGAEERAGLLTAVASRDVVGQAKGILMERHRVGPDEAFRMLARSSQTANRKLLSVARELAETGVLAGTPGPPPAPRPPLPPPRGPEAAEV
jgi:GAF domain-containing protein